MSDNIDNSEKWYNKRWLVAVLFLMCFPIGVYALWKSDVISKGWKFGVTGCFVLLLIVNRLSFLELQKEQEANFNKLSIRSSRVIAEAEKQHTMDGYMAYTDSLKNLIGVIQSTNLSESQKQSLNHDVNIADTTIGSRLYELKQKAEEEKRKAKEEAQRQIERKRRSTCLFSKIIDIPTASSTMHIDLRENGYGFYTQDFYQKRPVQITWKWISDRTVRIAFPSPINVFLHPIQIKLDSYSPCSYSFSEER